MSPQVNRSIGWIHLFCKIWVYFVKWILDIRHFVDTFLFVTRAFYCALRSHSPLSFGVPIHFMRSQPSYPLATPPLSFAPTSGRWGLLAAAEPWYTHPYSHSQRLLQGQQEGSSASPHEPGWTCGLCLEEGSDLVALACSLPSLSCLITAVYRWLYVCVYSPPGYAPSSPPLL